MSSSALDYITVQGFKSIASLEKLPLRPINILIGSNGSGKSNFIGVFAFLHAIREGRLRDYVIQAGGAEKVLHFGSKTTKQIDVRLSFEQEVNQYELVLSPTQDDGLYPSSETAFFWDKQRYPTGPYQDYLAPREQGREAGISDPQLTRTASWVRARLGGWQLYHLHDTSLSSPMRKTAKVNDNQFLRPDGSNLAAFLYFDQYFDSGSFSDGTLRFIALATLFLQPMEYLPSVVLVDEPELGLHPYAIEMLASLIRQASASTQVIVSTQSSLLLDHFDPEDVLVANRADGGTQIGRLEPSQLKEWLQDYSLGQLWEKNELTGRPLST